jgi:uncharacterized membrane protein
MRPSPHRATVITSGLLCCALILVVLFTSPAAFRSPAALVVMGSIGAAAVLIQWRLRRAPEVHPRSPIWFNVLGILLAAAALFPAVFRLRAQAVQALAFGAVGSFAISSAIVLHSFRKSAKPE